METRMACTKAASVSVRAIFRTDGGDELAIRRINSTQATTGGDGRLAMRTIVTPDLDAARQFHEGLEGILEERFIDYTTREEIPFVTPVKLRVVSCLPSMEERKIARAAITFVPADAPRTSGLESAITGALEALQWQGAGEHAIQEARRILIAAIWPRP